ncbi:hypothetical protein Ct61P_13103 [Colletotrichum tofieldiae]|nr:hypothetical protein Ct61P_13103 [Colletotrichum tofieldiae]
MSPRDISVHGNGISGCPGGQFGGGHVLPANPPTPTPTPTPEAAAASTAFLPPGTATGMICTSSVNAGCRAQKMAGKMESRRQAKSQGRHGFGTLRTTAIRGSRREEERARSGV